MVLHQREPRHRHLSASDVDCPWDPRIFFQHTDLRGILYTAALELGANIRTSYKVTEVEPYEHQVLLADGEVVKGDVMIGADGPMGLCKEAVTGHKTTPWPMNISFYTCVPNHIFRFVDELTQSGPASPPVPQCRLRRWPQTQDFEVALMRQKCVTQLL